MPANDEGPDKDFALTRRQTLGLAGTAGAAIVIGGKLTGFPGVDDSDAYLADAAKKCAKLTPELTEGPYYVDVNKVRRDIRESLAGVPLLLKIRIINPKTCKPIRHAAVDVWHASAAGKYSDIASEGTTGQTFLRGLQFTNKKGVATFQTVYVGHYAGRAPHIHVKVHTGSRQAGSGISGGHVAHTGQLFFPDATSASVYKTSAYTNTNDQVVLNAADGIYNQGGSKSVVNLSGSAAAGFTGTVILGVNPKATPVAAGGGGPGGP
jgi:protocatechuate 3,4-dioxygenase beta subunit